MTTRHTRRTAAVALAVTASALTAAALTAQPPAGSAPPPPPAVDLAPPAAQPAAFRVKQVLDTKVSIQGNIAIGTVEDLVISDAGDVEYLIVNNDGKLVTVPWSAATFDFAKKTAAVDLTAVQFRAVPTFTVTTYPQFFTPTYRTETYRFYGLTPGQLRRLDRKVDRVIERRP